jgi:hypothetical protein
MKNHRCLFLILAVTSASACDAAIINLTTPGVTTSLSLGYSSTIAQGTRFSSTSPPRDLTVTVDDVADTATFVAPELSVATPEFERTFERTFTTITPPTNFPDPPIVTTTRLVETITIDPAALQFQFLSSTPGELTFFTSSLSYQFRSDVRLMFPATFTVTGTYQVQGPTETITRPFTVVYNRTTGSPTLNGLWIGFIRPGSDYPETAIMGAIDILPFYPTYRPAPMTIFQGTVDGIQVTANLFDASTEVRLPMPVPESTSAFLWAVGFAMLAILLVPCTNRAKFAAARTV